MYFYTEVIGKKLNNIPVNVKTKNLFILFAVGLFFSCDPGSQIRYSVVNKTASELHLNVNPPSGFGLGGSYDLKPNDEVTIYADEVLGYAADIIEYKPMKFDFLKCFAVTKDLAFKNRY